MAQKRTGYVRGGSKEEHRRRRFDLTAVVLQQLGPLSLDVDM